MDNSAPIKTEPKLYIALPSYDGQSASKQIFSLSQIVKKGWIVAQTEFSSLAHSFNRAYADALNKRDKDGITHFLMLHADIIPHGRPGKSWIEILLEEMAETGADVMSAISPIKDMDGITSTGRMRPDVKSIERFTIRQIYKLPETFTFPDLVINTGCMLVDLRKEWTQYAKFYFKDWIEKDAEGRYVARTVSEDWNFSADAIAMGAKLYATRKVALDHKGTMYFGTAGVWGNAASDPNWPDSMIDLHIAVANPQKKIITPFQG